MTSEPGPEPDSSGFAYQTPNSFGGHDTHFSNCASAFPAPSAGSRRPAMTQPCSSHNPPQRVQTNGPSPTPIDGVYCRNQQPQPAPEPDSSGFAYQTPNSFGGHDTVVSLLTSRYSLLTLRPLRCPAARRTPNPGHPSINLIVFRRMVLGPPLQPSAFSLQPSAFAPHFPNTSPTPDQACFHCCAVSCRSPPFPHPSRSGSHTLTASVLTPSTIT